MEKDERKSGGRADELDGPDDEDIDLDDLEVNAGDSRYADLEGDEQVATALMDELLHCYMDAYEHADETPVILDAALRFIALAAHSAAYELAGMARDLDESAEEAASTMLREAHQAFVDYLTNQELFEVTGRALGEPPVNVRLDRKFRRTL